MGTLLSAVVQLFNCGMIGWRTFRIIVFLAIPSLVTSRLRALLLILIFVWSIQVNTTYQNQCLFVTYFLKIPGGNIMSNIQSTAEGIVCVQEQVKLLSEELQDSVDKNLRQVYTHIHIYFCFCHVFIKILTSFMKLINFSKQMYFTDRKNINIISHHIPHFLGLV